MKTPSVWDENSFRDVLAQLFLRNGDSAEIELKTALGGIPQSLGEDICAFANMPAGGVIIFGVSEREGFAITGVPDVAQLEQGVASIARDGVKPPPHVEFYTVNAESKDVLIARVESLLLSQKPALYKNKAYLRQSDGNYDMGPNELRMIEVAQLHDDEKFYADEQRVSGTGVEDLDPDLLMQFLSSVRSEKSRLRDRSDEEILRMMRVVTTDGTLTLAGLYGLGFFPQGAEPALGVTIAERLQRREGARIRELKEITGPVPVLLEETMAWMERNLPSRQVYSNDGNMRDHPELPLTAIREAVANALVHRDLSSNSLGNGKSVDIRLTPRMLLIVNPGGLKGLTIRQLLSQDLHRSAVNQRLYEIARHVRTEDGSRVIEGEGGGVQEMLRSAREAGLPEPDLVDYGVRFEVKIWREENPASSVPGVAPQSSVDQASTLKELVRQIAKMLDTDTPEHIDVEKIRQGLEGALNRNGPPAMNVKAGSEITKNGQAVVQALREGADTVKGISAITGLKKGQAKYALDRLIEIDVVIMDGTQGDRTTTYRLSD